MSTEQLKFVLAEPIWWQGYDRADTDDEVRAMFIERYGREPALIQRDGGGTWAGPIEKDERRSR